MRVRGFMRLLRGFVGVRTEGAFAQTLLIFKLKIKNVLCVFSVVGRWAGSWVGAAWHGATLNLSNEEGLPSDDGRRLVRLSRAGSGAQL
jgi:hypothetical protein